MREREREKFNREEREVFLGTDFGSGHLHCTKRSAVQV